MSITDTEADIIEAWTGDIPARDDKKVERMLRDLGSPYAVALQILSTRLSKFVVTPADVSADGDRVSHAANIKVLKERIGELGAFIQGDSSITLTGTGAALLTSVVGADRTATRAINLVIDNRRHAG